MDLTRKSLTRRRFIGAAFIMTMTPGVIKAVAGTVQKDTAASALSQEWIAKLNVIASILVPGSEKTLPGNFIAGVVSSGWQELSVSQIGRSILPIEKWVGGPVETATKESLSSRLKALDEECFGAVPPQDSDDWIVLKSALITAFCSSQDGAGKLLHYAPVPAQWLPDIPAEKAQIFYNDWLAMWFS